MYCLTLLSSTHYWDSEWVQYSGSVRVLTRCYLVLTGHRWYSVWFWCRDQTCSFQYSFSSSQLQLCPVSHLLLWVVTGLLDLSTCFFFLKLTIILPYDASCGWWRDSWCSCWWSWWWWGLSWRWGRWCFLKNRVKVGFLKRSLWSISLWSWPFSSSPLVVSILMGWLVVPYAPQKQHSLFPLDLCFWSPRQYRLFYHHFHLQYCL